MTKKEAEPTTPSPEVPPVEQPEHQETIPKKGTSDESLAIISMVLGVMSLTGPGFLFGIPAIVLAAIALKKNLAGKALSITGLVTGIISTVVSLLFIGLIIFSIIWAVAHPEPKKSPELQRPGNTTEQLFESSET